MRNLILIVNERLHSPMSAKVNATSKSDRGADFGAMLCYPDLASLGRVSTPKSFRGKLIT